MMEPKEQGMYYVGPIPPGARLVLIHEDVFAKGNFGTRTETGWKLTGEWGTYWNGYWDINFKMEDDGRIVVDKAALENAQFEADVELANERDWRKTLQLAIEKTLPHPSIRRKIRRRLEAALNDNERIP